MADPNLTAGEKSSDVELEPTVEFGLAPTPVEEFEGAERRQS